MTETMMAIMTMMTMTIMMIMIKMMMPIMVTLLSMLIMLGINGRELRQIMIPHIVLLFCIWQIFSFYAYIRKFAISSNAALSRLWHGLAYEHHSNAKILTVSVYEMDHNLFEFQGLVLEHSSISLCKMTSSWMTNSFGIKGNFTKLFQQDLMPFGPRI